MTLILHDDTKQAIDRFVLKPGHALLITAPTGAGKAAVAASIASELLHIPLEKLETHPYVKTVRPEKGKSISVEEVRDAIHFTTLRPTGNNHTTRVIIFEESQRMTSQAQNALLKTIEEPPIGTVIIMTAQSERSLLPTIRSRVQHIVVIAPLASDMQAYFGQTGHTIAQIEKAALMSGGLVGLMHAMLEADTAHPLFTAATTARDILQKSLFDRLVLADSLAKERELWTDTLFILAQMAHAALQQQRTDAAATRRWQKILHATYEAETETASSAQAKLVLLHFMLAI